MSGIDNYGLRAANRIVRELRMRMHGQRGDFVRGYRAALSDIDKQIASIIRRNIERQPEPQPQKRSRPNGVTG